MKTNLPSLHTSLFNIDVEFDPQWAKWLHLKCCACVNIHPQLISQSTWSLSLDKHMQNVFIDIILLVTGAVGSFTDISSFLVSNIICNTSFLTRSTVQSDWEQLKSVFGSKAFANSPLFFSSPFMGWCFVTCPSCHYPDEPCTFWHRRLMCYMFHLAAQTNLQIL